ncbi:MAG: aldo/keto reductase [Oscillospiraceae bacterium]|nr:aldo/keto reductase [Oscillospiraceae bacterium]MCL2159748.1 aldo/keto reductase [Oscillospiraceae bacterium]
MKKNILGKTGMKISAIVFGGIVVSGESPGDCARYVSYAVEKGVNYFDVAPSYNNAEEMLSPALAPYRKNVYLACKSTIRDVGIKDELHKSLKMLGTDYFDVYQLHGLSDQKDVDTAFSANGAMEILLRAKEEGYIRHIGITAHNESVAIQTLSYYDFETVMFPVNWALNMDSGFGDRLISICKYKSKGIIGIKSLAHRKWKEDDERSRFPKSWCKTIYDDDRLAKAAIRYALAKGADALVPPGNFEQFSYMVEHIDECASNLPSDEDMRILGDELENAKGHSIF